MHKHMSMESIPPLKEYSFAISTFQGGINTIDDEQNMPLSESPMAYNVTVADGSLKRCTGYGRAKRYVEAAGGQKELDELPAGAGIMMLYKTNTATSPKEYLAYYNEQGLSTESYNVLSEKIEWADVSGFVKSAGDVDFYVNYKLNNQDCLLFGSRSFGLYLWDSPTSAPILKANTPKLQSAVIHYERLFGVGDPLHINRIWFSAQFDPTDFTVSLDKGGYIDMITDKGRACKVLSFLDSVYVFWQYGISRIKAYNYQSDFSLSDVYSCDSEILADSIRQCGDRIIFTAKNGIYSFDGANVTLIGGRLGRFFTGKSICGGTECSVFFRQKYYVALSCPELDGYSEGRNNLLFEYDFTTGRFRMYKGCAICQMLMLHDHGDEKLLFIGDDGLIYCLDGSSMFGSIPICARWDTPCSNLGQPHLTKMCRELLLTASGEGLLKLTLTTENGSREKLLRLYPEPRIARLRFNLSGKLVRLSIENVNGNDFKAANPIVIYTAYRDWQAL